MLKIISIISVSIIVLFARSNIAYKKAEIKHKSQINGGYSGNGQVKYQYIRGKVHVNSNKVNIAGTKGGKNIENNIYGNSVSVVGRSGYSSRHRRETSVGEVDLKKRSNKNVKRVETYVDNVKIMKGR
jgi:hypothetical protein